jgi:hypothetical protein
MGADDEQGAGLFSIAQFTHGFSLSPLASRTVFVTAMVEISSSEKAAAKS